MSEPIGSNNYYGITSTNVQPLLVGSMSLNLTDFVEECIEFIRKDLTIENCISYFIFCIESSPAIRQAVIPFLWKNIKELGARPEFLYLNPDEVNSLLPVATDVNTLRNVLLDSESEFYSELLLSIFNWMNVDPIHRLDHFIAVSLKFPLASVRAEVLRQIYMENVNLRQNSTCHYLYLKIIESKFFVERSGSSQNSSQNSGQNSSTSSSQSSGTDTVSTTTQQNNRQCYAGTSTHTPRAGPKRCLENSEVEFLEVVPTKKNILAEIDLTLPLPEEAVNSTTDYPDGNGYFM